MRILPVFLVGFCAIAAATGAQQPNATPQPEPLLETGELMVMVIKPAYLELQQLMANPPVDRQQSALLYQKAARLAEFENLILFRPHARSATREWKTLAANARQTTSTLANSVLSGLSGAKAEDSATLRKNYEAIAASCNACHRAMSREAPTIRP